MTTTRIDALDCQLLTALSDTPRASVLELSRQLGVARGTAQSRLDRIQERGVVVGFGPDIDLSALGYAVLAFTTLTIDAGQLQAVVEHLRPLPEVLEVHATSGEGDLLCRIAARSTDGLQQTLALILAHPAVQRSATAVALSEQLGYRVLPLVAAAHLRQTDH